MLTAATLNGNWATLLLPVNSDQSIDYNILSNEVDYFIEQRVDGIYSNGTAGELHNQTEEEFYRIQEILAARCHAYQVPFQIGVSHPFPAVTLQRIKNTLSLRPSAYQVILPDWVITGPFERIAYMSRLSEEVRGIPLVLYNPPHAKSVLSAHELQHLCDAIPGLIGVKLAGGDDQWFKDMQWAQERLSVFVPGHLLASGVHKGVASGAYSNVACLSPGGAQWWWKLINTDLFAALEVEQRILQFFDECIVPYKNKGYSNPALDKLLAASGGWSRVGTRLRWPYKWIPQTETESVAKRARKYLPEFFNNSCS